MNLKGSNQFSLGNHSCAYREVPLKVTEMHLRVYFKHVHKRETWEELLHSRGEV